VGHFLFRDGLISTRFIVATSAYLMNSEKCVSHDLHSDSTMAKSAGLMRKPFINVCFHV
jgi:hypothetical protein